MTLILLGDWAREHAVDTGNARRYAEQGRIPGARKVGRDWLIPAEAPLLAHNVRPYLSPVQPPTPGQKRVREIIRLHLPRYEALGHPDLSLSSEYTRPEAQVLIGAVQEALRQDPVVRSDAVTGLHLDQPRVSRPMLTAEWAAKRAQVQTVRDGWVPVTLTHILDVPIRENHTDSLLGDKFTSTIATLLAMAAGQTISRFGVSVMIFPASGIVHVTSGGMHRALAALLYGQDGLAVEEATIVPGPINSALNDMAIRAALLAPEVDLDLSTDDYPDLMALDRRLALHMEETDRFSPRATRYDLVQKYLASEARGRYFPQTPGQLLRQFEHLDDYLSTLARRGPLNWLRTTLRSPVIDSLTLPEAQTPITRWYRNRLEEETYRQADGVT